MALKKYDLRFTALFYQDLMSAVDYIENTLKNPAAADRLISKAESEINKRLDYPLAFQPYPLKKERKYPYYAIPVGNYLAFYVVIGDTMEVRRFLYSRRDFDNLM
ncbi:MAG: type II toxin-antitoxin system RelE/ParE family toxin [Oscillospiraceae bacterium]|nr:type II toxin-antitoxin system RelE/ParE family toxin [Oscillospiraceae bacterium]